VDIEDVFKNYIHHYADVVDTMKKIKF